MSIAYYFVDHKNRTYYDFGSSFSSWRPAKFYEEFKKLSTMSTAELVEFEKKWMLVSVPSLLDCTSAKTEQELYERLAYYLPDSGFAAHASCTAKEWDDHFRYIARTLFAWLQAADNPVLVNDTDGSMDDFDLETYKMTGTRYEKSKA